MPHPPPSSRTLPRAGRRRPRVDLPGDPTPTSRFAVFFGAGAWFESGIPLAGTMVADFAGRIIEEQWPEACVDPQQQRVIDGKNPSFGYVVLANLMARNYITAVLTTHFDDLVYNE